MLREAEGRRKVSVFQPRSPAGIFEFFNRYKQFSSSFQISSPFFLEKREGGEQVFPRKQAISSGSKCPDIYNSIRNYFSILEIIPRFEGMGHSLDHRPSPSSLSSPAPDRRQSTVRPCQTSRLHYTKAERRTARRSRNPTAGNIRRHLGLWPPSPSKLPLI